MQEEYAYASRNTDGITVTEDFMKIGPNVEPLLRETKDAEQLSPNIDHSTDQKRQAPDVLNINRAKSVKVVDDKTKLKLINLTSKIYQDFGIMDDHNLTCLLKRVGRRYIALRRVDDSL